MTTLTVTNTFLRQGQVSGTIVRSVNLQHYGSRINCLNKSTYFSVCSKTHDRIDCVHTDQLELFSRSANESTDSDVPTLPVLYRLQQFSIVLYSLLHIGPSLFLHWPCILYFLTFNIHWLLLLSGFHLSLSHDQSNRYIAFVFQAFSTSSWPSIFADAPVRSGLYTCIIQYPDYFSGWRCTLTSHQASTSFFTFFQYPVSSTAVVGKSFPSSFSEWGVAPRRSSAAEE